MTEGSTCTVNVTFAPLGTGTRNGTVEITDGGGTVLTSTTISGLGVAAPPTAMLSTSLLQFGAIAFGSTETLPLTVENIGGGTLSFVPSIAGLSFTVAASTCGGGLRTGQSCTLQIEFSPVTVGAHNELLTLETEGSTNPTVALEGVAEVVVPPGTSPAAQVSTNYLPFGTIPFSDSETLPLTVTNIGGGTLTVATAFSGSSNFSIAGNTCGAGVTSGNSCTLQVRFAPTSIATHDGLLTVQTNGSAHPTVNLVESVRGLSVFGGANYAPLQFGTVSSGSTEVLQLTVTNIGIPATLTVGTAITVRSTTYPTITYTVLTTAQNTCLAGIASGQSCTLPVEFAPTSSGTHDDLLTLTPSAGGGSTSVWLLGSTP